MFEKFSLSGVNALPRFGSYSANPTLLSGLKPFSASIALYLHIPYCKSICQFCMLRRGAKTVMEVPDFFVDLLLQDLKAKSSLIGDARISSIYIGGGTPSMLSAAQVHKIFGELYRYINISEFPEITFEGEAQTLKNRSLLDALTFHNIQRVSFGVQTFDEELRKLLGRTDTLQDIEDLFATLSNYSFTEVNVDYLYNLPNTTPGFIENDLQKLLNYSPTSIDCHPLKYISCSSFMLQHIVEKAYSVPDSQQRIGMFNMIRNRLSKSGFVEQYADQYSKYGRDKTSFYMRHIYGLDGGEYIGIGPGARSHLADIGFNSFQNMDVYARHLSDNILPIEKVVLAPLADNYITAFPKRNDHLNVYNINKSEWKEYYFELLNSLTSQGYLSFEEGSYLLTSEGMNWYQNLQELLLSPQQRQNHKQSMGERKQKFEKFGSYFDNIGTIL